MAGSEEEGLKGPVAHQESKTFDGEYQLLTVFDNPDVKVVTFEAYSLETSEVLALRYSYAEFDQFFRFNAELMNPNNRDGRYHWIIKRLVFASDGSSGRKLALGGRPTDETPEIPVYTQAKIPTGRMNYNERQRLRDEMERLDMRRNENIEKKRMARDRKFMAELEEQKTLLALRQKSRMEKIASEKEERYGMIAEAHQEEIDRKMELVMLDKGRLEAIRQMEERRTERDEEGVKGTIAKHRQEREAKQKAMEALASQKVEIEEEIVKNEAAARTLAEDLETRREEQLEIREARIGTKEDTYLEWLQRRHQEELRKAEIVEEKKLNEVLTARQVREALFKEQFVVSAERRAYAEATRPTQPGEKVPALLNMRKMKKGKGSSGQKAAMDPVHEQMMEHLAQRNLSSALETQREERQRQAEKERNRQEADRAQEWKDAKQVLDAVKLDEYKKRTELREEKLAQQKADEARIKNDRARLDGLREMRIRDKAVARAQGT